MTKPFPFRYFKTSPESIRLAVLMYVRFQLLLRKVEDLLHDRDIDESHKTIRLCCNRFGPVLSAEIRRERAGVRRLHSDWQWHRDEIFVKVNGETQYFWPTVDHQGEVRESHVTRRRDRSAALKFPGISMNRYRKREIKATDRLKSYGAAMRTIG